MKRLFSLAICIVALLCIVAAPAMALTIVDPDAFADGTDISNAFPGITLSAISSGFGVTGKVFSVNPSDGSFAAQKHTAQGLSSGEFTFLDDPSQCLDPIPIPFPSHFNPEIGHNHKIAA